MSSQSTPTAKKGTPSKASSSAPKIPRVTFKTASKQTLKRYQQTNTLKELQQGIAKTKKAIELQSTSTNKGQQQSSPNSTGAPVTRSPANLGVKLAFSPRPQNDAERAVTFISKCLQEARNTKTAKTNFDNSKESFEDGGENVVGGTLSSIDKNDVIAADLIANSPWEANDLKTEDTELSSANLATKNTTPDQCIVIEEDEDDGASISSVTSSNESLGPMQSGSGPRDSPNTADQPEASKEGLHFSINHGKADPLKIVEKATALTGPNTFYNKVISENMMNFQCFSIKTADALKELFTKQGHRIVEPNQKTRKIILSHLNPRTPIDWIHTELVKQGFAPVKVSNLRNGSDLPSTSFRIELTPQGEAPVILDITHLGTFMVNAYEMKPKAVYQCFRCQKFDHHVSNCKSPVQICFKCTGPHRGSECQKSKLIDAICANCGGNHVASNTLCPAYRKACQVQMEIGPPPKVSKSLRDLGWDNEAAFDSLGSYSLQPSNPEQITPAPKRRGPMPPLMRINKK
ncbi:hypothetical protein ACLKA6_003283 [Drosophila palustris]